MLSISGNNASGVFSVASGVTASISGLTITGGLAHEQTAAASTIRARSSCPNLAVTGNAAAFGGGVANELTGNLTVVEFDLLAEHSEASSGAARFVNFNQLVLSYDTFTGNIAIQTARPSPICAAA